MNNKIFTIVTFVVQEYIDIERLTNKDKKAIKRLKLNIIDNKIVGTKDVEKVRKKLNKKVYSYLGKFCECYTNEPSIHTCDKIIKDDEYYMIIKDGKIVKKFNQRYNSCGISYHDITKPYKFDLSPVFMHKVYASNRKLWLS